MNVTVRMEKLDEKNEVICLVSMFTSRVVVLTSSKRVHHTIFWKRVMGTFKCVYKGYFRNWGQHPEDTEKGIFHYKKVNLFNFL